MYKRIEFSVLSYYPSLLTNENINVGIAIQCKEEDYSEFYHVHKWSRVEQFDDELDIDIFKATILGIKNKMTSSLVNNQSDDFFKFTKFFVGELKFSSIKTIESELFEEGVDYIKKIHLKYDFDKNERLNENQTKDYVKMLLKSNSESVTQKAILGSHNENLHFDFVIDEKTLVKIIKISDNNHGIILHNAKSWAWTNNEIGDKYKIIYLILQDELSDKSLSSEIISILDSSKAETVDYYKFVDNISKYVKPSNSIFAMIQ